MRWRFYHQNNYAIVDLQLHRGAASNNGGAEQSLTVDGRADPGGRHGGTCPPEHLWNLGAPALDILPLLNSGVWTIIVWELHFWQINNGFLGITFSSAGIILYNGTPRPTLSNRRSAHQGTPRPTPSNRRSAHRTGSRTTPGTQGGNIVQLLLLSHCTVFLWCGSSGLKRVGGGGWGGYFCMFILSISL